VEKIKGVIFDIDGVIEFQGSVYPGAIETVDALRGRGIALRFLTNSTLKSRASCTAKLREAGFQVSYEEVITASYATAVYLGKLKPRSCWIMLEREGLDEFRDFYQDTENPEYIVVGDNRSRFDFEHMNKVLRLLLGEAELNVGSWVGMLERASGVKATYVGKPNAHVFELALRSMGLGKDEVVMVGDRVSTDIKGAKDFGMRAVLLRTGEFEEPDLASGVEPDFVFDSIQEVLSVFEPGGTGRAEETGSCRGQGEWRRKGQ
jgi:ribonucleotide monophosphatase NagD (HAD superfamily)